MSRLALALLSLFPALALAGPREDAVAQALEQVQEAREEADDATGACKRALKDLGPLSTQLTALKKDATDKGLTRAKELAQDVSDAVKDDCKGSLAKHVRKSLDKAVAQLERAQEAKGSTPPAAAQPGTNVLVSLAGGIGSLFGGGNSNTTAHKTETHSSKRTEEINGKPIDGDDEDDAPPARKATKAAPSRGGFQATCQHNSDCDSAFRRRIGIQLNKGEALHALRRFLFLANEGLIRRRASEEQVNQVACLNLVTNAVIAWNTTYMAAVLERLRAEGHSFTDTDVAHLSPARYEHVNPYGKYRFEPARYRKSVPLRPLRPA